MAATSEPATAALTFKHARWFEPHEAKPVVGSIRPVRAHGPRLTAECATCGEILLEVEGA